MRLQLLVAGCLLFCSCKKDVVCECTLTVSATSTEPGFVFTEPPPKKTSTTYQNVSSDNDAVEAACATTVKTEEIPYKTSSQGKLNDYTLVRTTRNECTIR
jgi:hypothetical protein